MHHHPPEPDAAIEPNEEKVSSRLNANLIVACCALAIGVFSLGLGIYEAQLERHHQRLIVWPHLQVEVVNHAAEGATLVLSNQGLGPALIGDAHITVDDQPKRSWEEAFAAILDTAPPTVSSASISHRVMRAGQQVNVVTLPAKFLPADIRERIGRVKLQIPYSSVFEEWSVLSFPRGLGESSQTTSLKHEPPASDAPGI